MPEPQPRFQPVAPPPIEPPVRMIHVVEEEVLKDLQTVKAKGVDIYNGKEVSLEFIHGDDEIALADYVFLNGAFHLVRAYEKDVVWPREFSEPTAQAGDNISAADDDTSAQPPESPPPPSIPPARPVKTELTYPDASAHRYSEALNQYEYLQRQIRQAQYNIEQAQLTGQSASQDEQTRRLEIGQRNLERLLQQFPALTDLSRDTFPPVNLATAEGRERARKVIMDSDLASVEKGKRVVVLHKADASVETRHPALTPITAKTASRPPMRMALTDLRDAQRDVQHLNNQGLLAQFGNSEQRHNNLLRLQSTRRTLELLLKRFPILPGVAQQEQKNLLGLIYSVIESSRKLEQGTNSNFLSRFWNQAALREESSKMTRGLKLIDQFIATHPGFI